MSSASSVATLIALAVATSGSPAAAAPPRPCGPSKSHEEGAPSDVTLTLDGDAQPGAAVHELSCLGRVTRVCGESTPWICELDRAMLVSDELNPTLVVEASRPLTFTVLDRRHALTPACPAGEPATCARYQARVTLDLKELLQGFGFARECGRELCWRASFTLGDGEGPVVEGSLAFLGFDVTPEQLDPSNPDQYSDEDSGVMALMNSGRYLGVLPSFSPTPIIEAPFLASVAESDLPIAPLCPDACLGGSRTLTAPIATSLRIRSRSSDREQVIPLPTLAAGTTCPCTTFGDWWSFAPFMDLIVKAWAEVAQLKGAPPAAKAGALMPLGLTSMRFETLLAKVGGDRGRMSQLLLGQVSGLWLRGSPTSPLALEAELLSTVVPAAVEAAGLDPTVARLLNRPLAEAEALFGPPSARRPENGAVIVTWQPGPASRLGCRAEAAVVDDLVTQLTFREAP